MNTFVKALPHRQYVTRAKAQSRALAMKQILLIVLLSSVVLLNAFAVVYVKDLYRRMFIDYQNLQNAQSQLYVDWGKLLLEQSTWSTQARIQTIATQRLNMAEPTAKQVIVLQGKS